MKRRKFCHYLTLGSVTFAGEVGRDTALTINQLSGLPKLHYSWGILYWMPYDNNLVRFGEPIIEMLRQGTEQNPDIVVVVQSDYRGDPKMRRRQLIDGAITEIEIAGEDSSNALDLYTYLEWANQTLIAEHWAVIVVGHGGRINQISPDEHTIIRQPLTWMRIDQFTDAVAQFNQDTNGKVELLFFQNCNKATLEVIYQAKNCARYTLASQCSLGAPNYYYQGFLNGLKGLSTGRDVALAIIDSEHSDMYHTLTLVDNQAVENIPDQLSALVQVIINQHSAKIERYKLPIHEYSGEQHCDLLALFDFLCTTSNQGQKEFMQFSQFLRSSVISYYQTGGKLYDRHFLRNLQLCGISLYLPKSQSAIARYCSLSLYQNIELIPLFQKLLA